MLEREGWAPPADSPFAGGPPQLPSALFFKIVLRRPDTTTAAEVAGGNSVGRLLRSWGNGAVQEANLKRVSVYARMD